MAAVARLSGSARLWVSLAPARSSPRACLHLHRLRCRGAGARAALFSTATAPLRAPEYRIDQDRLMSDIHHTCQWGTGERWGDAKTETGMSRLSLSKADKQVRDWFADTTSSLGCDVTTDEMGNQFAVRPGKRDGAPTYAGSHLDTQPTGGRYDGILGVTAAVEMLRVLDDHRVQTEYPVGVVNWTNEEGARFPVSMLSSGVWAGSIPLEKAHSIASVVPSDGGITVRSALQKIGYLGSTPCSHTSNPMAAHFELHIEQGPHLEKARRKIGIVEGVQAYRWYTITVSGRDTHTGTTDLSSRADALLAASKMIVAAREVAWQEGGLASVGIIQAKPGSTNTVPGSVRFSLDVRGKLDETVKQIERRLRETFAFIAGGKSSVHLLDKVEPPSDIVKVEWRLDSDTPATHFDGDCIECVRAASEEVFGSTSAAAPPPSSQQQQQQQQQPGGGAAAAAGAGSAGAAGLGGWQSLTQRMVSGAGHDSVYTSRRVPTSMIFVPCRGGVSHNPIEFCSPEDCAVGAQVLMGAVLKFDELRARKRGAAGGPTR